MLADTIARLEGGADGIVVVLRNGGSRSGLSQLESGDLIVAPHDRYAGTYRLLAARRDKEQFDVAFIDQSDDAARS